MVLRMAKAASSGQAYYEHPMYVPLVNEAYHLWFELEQAYGRQLLLQTGGLMLGTEHSAIVKGAKLSAQTHNIPYEYLDSKDINQRFPALKTRRETVGVLENKAGILFPEECVKASLALSVINGALVLLNERVTVIQPDSNIITISTDKSSYQARKLIVSAGRVAEPIIT